MKTRIYFLDNLRTFLIFLVIVVHAGMVYESGFGSFWIIDDPSKVNKLSLVRLYLDVFVMFIMFFISGYFIPYSIKNKTPWNFIKSKVTRIIIPWLVAVFTLIPAYKAIFLYSRDLPQELWYTYFHIFQKAGSDLGYFPDNPTQSWLWFLPVLFLFQIVYLILYKSNLLKLNLSIKTAVFSTLIIGLMYSMFISIIGLKGWTLGAVFDFQRERLLVYFMVFLLGSLCHKLKIFDNDYKNKKLYFILNFVLTLSLIVFTVFAINLFYNMIDAYRNNFIISKYIDKSIFYLTLLISMLSFLYIFIYTFRFTFNKANNIMKILNRDSYYVYIIHMIVLGLLAFLLLKISIIPIIKYFILIVLTFIISYLITYIVRKTIPKLNSKITTPLVLIITLILSTIIFFNTNNYNKNIPHSLSDISKGNQPKTGFHQAALEGNIEEIQKHILVGTDLNFKDKSSGNSPIITAAAFGKTEVVKILIEAGANINFQGSDGSTALHASAYFCQLETVKLLLENGIDKNIKDKSNNTATDVVSFTFSEAKPGYDYFKKALEPQGLELDYEYLKTTRPVIAELIKNSR